LSDETAETQVKGDTNGATRYAKIFGGEIMGAFRKGDAPEPESRMPGSDDLVMNMSMKLGHGDGV
jgi:hypothetical protein